MDGSNLILSQLEAPFGSSVGHSIFASLQLIASTTASSTLQQQHEYNANSLETLEKGNINNDNTLNEQIALLKTMSSSAVSELMDLDFNLRTIVTTVETIPVFPSCTDLSTTRKHLREDFERNVKTRVQKLKESFKDNAANEKDYVKQVVDFVNSASLLLVHRQSAKQNSSSRSPSQQQQQQQHLPAFETAIHNLDNNKNTKIISNDDDQNEATQNHPLSSNSSPDNASNNNGLNSPEIKVNDNNNNNHNEPPPTSFARAFINSVRSVGNFDNAEPSQQQKTESKLQDDKLLEGQQNAILLARSQLFSKRNLLQQQQNSFKFESSFRLFLWSIQLVRSYIAILAPLYYEITELKTHWLTVVSKPSSFFFRWMIVDPTTAARSWWALGYLPVLHAALDHVQALQRLEQDLVETIGALHVALQGALFRVEEVAAQSSGDLSQALLLGLDPLLQSKNIDKQKNMNSSPISSPSVAAGDSDFEKAMNATKFCVPSSKNADQDDHDDDETAKDDDRLVFLKDVLKKLDVTVADQDDDDDDDEDEVVLTELHRASLTLIRHIKQAMEVLQVNFPVSTKNNTQDSKNTNNLKSHEKEGGISKANNQDLVGTTSLNNININNPNDSTQPFLFSPINTFASQFPKSASTYSVDAIHRDNNTEDPLQTISPMKGMYASDDSEKFTRKESNVTTLEGEDRENANLEQEYNDDDEVEGESSPSSSEPTSSAVAHPHTEYLPKQTAEQKREARERFRAKNLFVAKSASDSHLLAHSETETFFSQYDTSKSGNNNVDELLDFSECTTRDEPAVGASVVAGSATFVPSNENDKTVEHKKARDRIAAMSSTVKKLFGGVSAFLTSPAKKSQDHEDENDQHADDISHHHHNKNHQNAHRQNNKKSPAENSKLVIPAELLPTFPSSFLKETQRTFFNKFVQEHCELLIDLQKISKTMDAHLAQIRASLIQRSQWTVRAKLFKAFVFGTTVTIFGGLWWMNRNNLTPADCVDRYLKPIYHSMKINIKAFIVDPLLDLAKGFIVAADTTVADEENDRQTYVKLVLDYHKDALQRDLVEARTIMSLPGLDYLGVGSGFSSSSKSGKSASLYNNNVVANPLDSPDVKKQLITLLAEGTLQQQALVNPNTEITPVPMDPSLSGDFFSASDSPKNPSGSLRDKNNRNEEYGGGAASALIEDLQNAFISTHPNAAPPPPTAPPPLGFSTGSLETDLALAQYVISSQQQNNNNNDSSSSSPSTSSSTSPQITKHLSTQLLENLAIRAQVLKSVAETAVKSNDDPRIRNDFISSVRRPISALVFGQLVRLLLIDVQRQKVDMSRIMASSQNMMRQQDLNFKIFAMMPVAMLVSGVFVIRSVTRKSVETPLRRELLASWRALHSVVTRSRCAISSLFSASPSGNASAADTNNNTNTNNNNVTSASSAMLFSSSVNNRKNLLPHTSSEHSTQQQHHTHSISNNNNTPNNNNNDRSINGDNFHIEMGSILLIVHRMKMLGRALRKIKNEPIPPSQAWAIAASRVAALANGNSANSAEKQTHQEKKLAKSASSFRQAKKKKNDNDKKNDDDEEDDEETAAEAKKEQTLLNETKMKRNGELKRDHPSQQPQQHGSASSILSHVVITDWLTAFDNDLRELEDHRTTREQRLLILQRMVCTYSFCDGKLDQQ